MLNRFLCATFALFLAFTPARGDDTGKNEQARQMFESLFTPPGQLPVQDLVAEGEELEAEGVVVRTVVPSTPVRVDYALTVKGRALGDVVAAVAVWAETWSAPPPEKRTETG